MNERDRNQAVTETRARKRGRVVAEKPFCRDGAGTATERNRSQPSSGACRCGAAWHVEHPRCLRGHPRPGHPGPALRAGKRATTLPAADVPAEGAARASLRLLMSHANRMSEHLAGHKAQLSDVRHLAELMSIVREARELETALGAERAASTCGWGHPLCPYASDPAFEARLLVRAAVERLYPLLMTREPDSITEVLLADDSLREDVLYRLRSAAADKARSAAAAQRVELDDGDVPQTVAFDAEGNVVPLTEPPL